MTFNCKFYARDNDPAYGEIKEWAKTCPGSVLLSENEWFNGKYGGRQIRGAGFELESDLLVFILKFKDRVHWFERITNELKWGYDPTDMDF